MVLILLALMLIAQPLWAETTRSLQSTPILLPGGQNGIGFDDINFSKEAHKLLVPAGHTGKLYLMDPADLSMTSLGQFTSSAKFQKGHKVGISTADEAQGFLFVADHGTHQLEALNSKTGAVVASTTIAGDPDILRYVDTTHEIWVTEPDNEKNKQIEVFSFDSGKNPRLSHRLDIPVADGPESLTIDNSHHKAYTNLGKDLGVIDLRRHKVTAQWANDCAKPRGTAVDTQKGFIFDSCGEGKTRVFNQKGRTLGEITTDAGIDLIDYNPSLSHLYVTGSKAATVSVVGVSAKGKLSLLGTGHAAVRSHCVAGDDHDNIWVCDPQHGQLLRYKDTFAKTK